MLVCNVLAAVALALSPANTLAIVGIGKEYIYAQVIYT